MLVGLKDAPALKLYSLNWLFKEAEILSFKFSPSSSLFTEIFFGT